MVFVAPVHPLWWVVRRSIQLLTGAAMLAAMMGSGYSPPESAELAVSTARYVSVSIRTVSIHTVSTHPTADHEFVAPRATLSEPTPYVLEPVQAFVLTLTSISEPAGRLGATAISERAPPRR